MLLVALSLPIIGNSIIIASGSEAISYIGCYLYFIGLDWSVLALLVFTTDYCDIKYRGRAWYIIVFALVVIDSLQLLANIFTGHAFTLQEITFEGAPYFSLVPFLGQNIHRVICYGIFFVSIGIFVYKCFTVTRVYLERYLIILLSMIFTGGWESYFIFSGSPVDRSMIAFGVFGLLVFYFALYYKPFRLLDRMLARVVATLNEAVLFFDAESNCIFMNELAYKVLGLEGEKDLSRALELAENLVNDKLPINFEWSGKRHVKQDGEDVYWMVEVRHLVGSKGRVDGFVLSLRDITADQERLLKERHLATHDRLTGLFNKDFMYEEIRRTIDEHPGVKYYIGAIDVKDFKLFNDIFSKEFGDEILKEIADRVRKNATPGDVYGRISGDKFGFLKPIEHLDLHAMEGLLRDTNYEKQGLVQPVVVHMGIYEIDDRSVPVGVMFDRAFMAIGTIKNDYQRHVAKYDAAMREETIWDQSISNHLDEAISAGQIRPYLQPLVDESGKVQGAEVLVRWIHPEKGFLSPASFIPVFEKNGMIAKLDTFMWECACKILRSWQDRGIDMFLSVNISPKDFYFIDVYETIKSIVEKYGVEPSRLRLEITETVMMSDLEHRLRILEDLRDTGFIVEMDDFGSGYSSLNMLKDIPVDVLKIDMMFLYKTKDQDKAQTILQTIINLSQQLGMPSITEGVETADQLDMLLNMGCRMFQGYFFAKPMPVEEFEAKYRAA